MTTTNTWKIVELDRETANGFVFTAHYTVDASDGTYKAGAYGSIDFKKPETLVPYADLTEEIVLGWVKEELGGAEKVAEIEAKLQKALDEQAAPSTSTGTPW